MVAWTEYKAQAKSRGALALEMYVAQSTPVDGPEAVKANLEDHLTYIRQLETSGRIMCAGPLSDDTGDHMQGVGMIVYRAQSLAEARALAEADPMHASGARAYTLRRWMINEGSISVTVGLSSNTVELG